MLRSAARGQRRGGTGQGVTGRGGIRGRSTAADPHAPYIASGNIKSGLPYALDKMIPDAMKACTTGWIEVPMQEQKFVIFTDEEYSDKYLRNGLIDSYLHTTDSISRHLVDAGLNVNVHNTV